MPDLATLTAQVSTDLGDFQKKFQGSTDADKARDAQIATAQAEQAKADQLTQASVDAQAAEVAAAQKLSASVQSLLLAVTQPAPPA